jgi:hypothetical protein
MTSESTQRNCILDLVDRQPHRFVANADFFLDNPLSFSTRQLTIQPPNKFTMASVQPN